MQKSSQDSNKEENKSISGGTGPTPQASIKNDDFSKLATTRTVARLKSEVIE